ncbi:hypothetical protein K435DRAFT_932897 [Dendrothele bispora CBS 962.96]|uniref:Glucose-methanol-choline oxidoreductase C-terminal domain-containing protein n=1 Tax=Dendrothele bispora (strain CBS 962.96) TaxID=1314807 RepID=A0A4S8L2H5_DENBC|nr:hypothetical protein K435DRAFT_932897 [Dendrothele bispora CBS 962.96]
MRVQLYPNKNGFAALGDTKQLDEEGSLTLASAEAEPSPILTSTTVSSSTNSILSALQQALRDADTFLNAAPWTSPSPYIIAPFGDWAIARDGTDADREAYIRKNPITVYHPVGTAKTSSASGATGVTDSRSRVKESNLEVNRIQPSTGARLGVESGPEGNNTDNIDGYPASLCQKIVYLTNVESTVSLAYATKHNKTRCPGNNLSSYLPKDSTP